LVPVSDELPEYCSVFGTVSPAVTFEVRLPTTWNGKLYFAGNGGFAGNIEDTSFGLVRGYATASTDTGHEADFLDASWALNNRPAEQDYGYRAVHVTTLAAKILIASYYGQGPRLSYFDGCSKGGQQAMREAEQYPGDFNGIAAGAPALDFTGFMVAANWYMQAVHATAFSTDVPPEKIPMIDDNVLAVCDAVDGLVDGLIDDPRRCPFDPETLRCRHGDGPDCLTPRQVKALKKIYAGPTDSRGFSLFPGLSVGVDLAENNNAPDYTSSLFILQDQFFRYLAFRVDDPNFDWTTFNFDSDPPPMRFMANILNADSTDLSKFHEAGGKLLLYHGWSDPLIAPMRTIDYYEDVQRRLGVKTTRQFVRLFLEPGMSHCGNGTGPNSFDYFSALEGWVERGVSPESMVAFQLDDNGNVLRSRPLCAYPRVARYKGHGSVDDAANFRCVEPEGTPTE
jgi:feruloyl esterase